MLQPQTGFSQLRQRIHAQDLDTHMTRPVHGSLLYTLQQITRTL